MVPSAGRVSSTLFSHIASDETLSVLEPFKNDENVKKYPAMRAGEQVAEELKAIELAKV